MVNNSTDKKVNKNGGGQGMHPKCRINLDKGRMGDNHAKKKDYSITRIIKEMLNDLAEERWLEPEDKDKELTWRQAIAKRMLVEATRGNAKVTGELLDRVEGKVALPVNASGTVTLRVKYDDDSGISRD